MDEFESLSASNALQPASSSRELMVVDGPCGGRIGG